MGGPAPCYTSKPHRYPQKEAPIWLIFSGRKNVADGSIMPGRDRSKIDPEKGTHFGPHFVDFPKSGPFLRVIRSTVAEA